jgi:hypothetical protein
VLPGGVTVRDRPVVRRLAAALCGLPKPPRGLVACPAQRSDPAYPEVMTGRLDK